MALVKGEFPILDYDTEQKAILMPDRKKLFKLPCKCVMAFLGSFIDNFAFNNNLPKIAEFDTVSGTISIFKLNYKSYDVCICFAPLGSSAATSLLDFLISYGVKHIISCGSCGTLHEISENEILIPVSALRDEGTSYHYLPPAREVLLNRKAIESIKKAANKFKINYEECKTWTTDGFYRETKDLVAYRKSEGCDVVEMECAALTACAQFRNATFGQILFTADTLAVPDKHDDRSWGESSWENVFKLSLEAVCYISEQDDEGRPGLSQEGAQEENKSGTIIA